MENNYKLFFALLRTAMTGEPFEPVPSAQAWAELYEMAGQQSVMGVCYSAFSRISKEQQPPMEILMQWIGEAETIRGMNELQNQEAARLTRLFSEQGRKTAILKGQANARLYPDSFSRQPGDIDIWVEGGHDSVLDLLSRMKLINGIGKIPAEGKAMDSYHHIHIPTNKQGVVVEVHFRPSSGNRNPVTNRRLQQWLEQEILNATMVPEGFNVPSIRFALMMQLAHIQRHFLSEGIGLRHICDYYVLLQKSTAEDRQEVASWLKPFGLRHTAEALMWVLGEVLHLEEEKMYCGKDPYRGEWMLREIMEGGNFGHYSESRQHGVLRRVMETRWYHLQLMLFDFWEVLWLELSFWNTVIKTLPTRIRYRTISLSDIKKA